MLRVMSGRSCLIFGLSGVGVAEVICDCIISYYKLDAGITFNKEVKCRGAKLIAAQINVERGRD